MSTVLSDSRFVRRFDALWLRVCRVRLAWTVCLLVAGSLAGLGLLILADYVWELSSAWRAGGLAAWITLSTVWAIVLLQQFLRHSSRPETAREIESAFPRLGQSVRTVVQFSASSVDEVAASGVREGLIAALEQETHQRSRSMHLDSLVPVRALWTAFLILVCLAVGLAGLSAVSWEWRLASQRVFLTERPYTRLSIAPGDLKVLLGQPVQLRTRLEGRVDRPVTVRIRPVQGDNRDWTEHEYQADEKQRGKSTELQYVTEIKSLKQPLEYQAVCGTEQTPIYRLSVRYPLALKRVEAIITPPAYTGHPPVKSEDPNLTAVEGSQVQLTVTFDQPPRTASLVLIDLSRRGPDDPPVVPETVPLAIRDSVATATLPLSRDLKYSIVAETEDGLRLPENSYRIRVRPDQAPEVYFEAPEDPLEVTTLAEILMRIRVRDDFGIARAGIVFEVNNEEEYPLLTQEFPLTREALTAAGRSSPETQAALEKILPLEHFGLRQTDSVAYYAFVEDNLPGTPHRTVTDLRFIDIRPFRTRFTLRDDTPANGDTPPGPKIATLEELIKRQRVNLNRSMNFARQSARQETLDLNSVETLIASEALIAKATRELAEFLSNLNIEELTDEIQLLLSAEAHMLAAADSLGAAKYDTAVLQERDALKELIEGRNRLQIFIQKNPRRLKNLAEADLRLSQKLRRPKSDAEEARELVRRIRQLSMEQGRIQSELTMAESMPQPMTSKSTNQTNGDKTTGAGKPNESEKPTETGRPTEAGTTDGPGKSNPDEAEKKKTENGPSDPDAAASSDPEKPEVPSSASGKPASGKPASTEPDEKATSPSLTQPAGGENEQPGADATGEPSQSRRARSRQELREQQSDNLAEGRDLATSIDKLKSATELVKTRIAAANKLMEATQELLDQGQTGEAANRSGEIVAGLDELAQQLESLIKEEAAERLQEAKRLASQLANRQQMLAGSIPGPNQSNGLAAADPKADPQPSSAGGTESPKEQQQRDPADQNPEANGGAGKSQTPPQTKATGGQTDPKQPDRAEGDVQPGAGSPSEMNPEKARSQEEMGASLAQQAERNAETGRTILDLLDSIRRSSDPGDQAAAEKVEAALRENKLDETVGRMQSLAEQLKEAQFAEAEAAAADSADRWGAMANRLDSAYRDLSAPTLQNLMELEKELQTLQEQLNELRSERDLERWHARVQRLLNQLEKENAGGETRRRLEELLAQSGWLKESEQLRRGGGGQWTEVDGLRRWIAPGGYETGLRAVTADLQARIQELILGELSNTADELQPPEYEKLVQRYYETLARQKRTDRP